MSEGEKRVLVSQPRGRPRSRGRSPTARPSICRWRKRPRRFGCPGGTGEKAGGPSWTLPSGGPPRSEPITWHGGEGYRSGSVRFVGRLTQFWQIHNALQRRSGLAGPGDPSRGIVVVSGFRGCREVTSCGRVRSSLPGLLPRRGGSGNCRLLGHAVQDTQAVADTRTIPDTQTDGGRPSSAEWPSALAWSRRASMILTPCGRWSRLELDERATHALGRRRLAKRAQRYGIWRMELRFGPCRTNWSRRETLGLDWLPKSRGLEGHSNRTKPSCCLAQGRVLEREETIEARGLTEDLGFHPLACDVAGLYVKRKTASRSPPTANSLPDPWLISTPSQGRAQVNSYLAIMPNGSSRRWPPTPQGTGIQSENVPAYRGSPCP